MVFLDGPKNVRMERLARGALSAYGYTDEFHRWAGGVPRAKAEEHGCAALVHGNRIHARFWQIGLYGAALLNPDTSVIIRMVHRHVSRDLHFGFRFDVKGRIFPRLVFPAWVLETLANARQD